MSINWFDRCLCFRDNMDTNLKGSGARLVPLHFDTWYIFASTMCHTVIPSDPYQHQPTLVKHGKTSHADWERSHTCASEACKCFSTNPKFPFAQYYLVPCGQPWPIAPHPSGLSHTNLQSRLGDQWWSPASFAQNYHLCLQVTIHASWSGSCSMSQSSWRSKQIEVSIQAIDIAIAIASISSTSIITVSRSMRMNEPSESSSSALTPASQSSKMKHSVAGHYPDLKPSIQTGLDVLFISLHATCLYQ